MTGPDDAQFDDLLRQSSLGGRGASRLRKRTPPQQAQIVRDLGWLRHRIGRELGDVAEATSLVADLLRTLGHHEQAQFWEEGAANQVAMPLRLPARLFRPRSAGAGAKSGGVSVGRRAGSRGLLAVRDVLQAAPVDVASPPRPHLASSARSGSLTPPDQDIQSLSTVEARVLLGAEMRRLRRHSGIDQGEAAAALFASRSRMSRMESGRAAFRLGDLSPLLELYGPSVAMREWLVQLACRARDLAMRELAGSFSDLLLELETAASLIRTYEMQVVPYLLQAPSYCRALQRSRSPLATSSDISRKVATCMERQEIFRRNRHSRLWAIVDETALYRRVSRSAEHYEQVERLLELSRREDIVVQVLPLKETPMPCSTTILRPHARDLPDVAYVQHLTGGLYVDEPSQVESYRVSMDRLSAMAESPEASEKRLQHLLETAV